MQIKWNCPTCEGHSWGVNLYGTHIYRLFCPYCAIAIQDLTQAEILELEPEEKAGLNEQLYTPLHPATLVYQEPIVEKVTQEESPFIGIFDDQVSEFFAPKETIVMATEQPVAEVMPE